MSDEKLKLWSEIKNSRGILNVYDIGLAQDVFSEVWDYHQSKLDYAVKALEEIKYMDKIAISCPDNRKGCLVAHYTLGEHGKRARLALEEINNSNYSELPTSSKEQL